MNEDRSGIGGHPKGLTTLFFTEVWERFSYYGMRAILVLYMVAPIERGGLGFGVAKATFIYGLYTSSVYLTALPGGLIADKLLGARAAVLVGGIVIALGHFSMIVSSQAFFYSGLVLIAFGTGLLKPNISAMVGSLYGPDDPRRDGGFSIFYMGINIGGMISPIVCGYLAQSADFQSRIAAMGFDPLGSWHWGFGAAGLGMTLGLTQYLAQRQRLAKVGLKPPSQKVKEATHSDEALTGEEWRRIGAVAILFVFTVIFFGAFEQSGSSLTLFADQFTANSVSGWNFPSAWFQSVNSCFIILLAPIFSVLWVKLGTRAPSSPAKFSIGLLGVSLGYILLVPAALLTASGKVSPLWLIGLYFLHTVGELCLSPVGLSTVTKLAPKRFVGLMMGIWFLAASMGNYLSGWAGGLFRPDPTALAKLFCGNALVTLVAGIVLALIIPRIRKLMGSVR